MTNERSLIFRLVAAAVAIAILVLIDLPVSFGDSANYQTEALQTLLHTAFFFLLMICTAVLLRSTKKAEGVDARLLWKSTAVCLCLGIVTELLQIPSVRTASLFDFIANLAGIVFGWVWLANRHYVNSRKRKWMLSLAGVGLVLIAQIPVISGELDEAARRRAIPNLMSLDDGHTLWVGQGDARLAVESVGNQQVLAVDCPAGSYQGLRIEFGEPVDLSAYSKIQFEMINQGIPIELGVRVDHVDVDSIERRGYGVLTLKQGDNVISLDLDRFKEPDSSPQVVRIAIFGGENSPSRHYQMRTIELQ